MNLRDEDLNLLIVFEALMQTRSVSKASEHLGLTQPTMSHALSKMRKSFDDPMFIRVKNEMLPTPHASRIAPAVKQVLDLARAEIFRRHTFDPEVSTRSFTLCMSDVAQLAYLPLIVREVRRQAPQVRLKTVSPMAEKLEEGLESGSVDLAVGYFPDVREAGVFQQRLRRSKGYICIASADNSDMARGELDARSFAAMPHVAVRTEGRSQEVIEKAMNEQGIRRNVVVSVPSFLALFGLVPQSDLVAIVSVDLADRFRDLPGLVTHTLPFPSPRVDIIQLWHERYQKDAASQWLRGAVHQALQEA